ncbi:MAG: thioredoxin [Planctomycetota bacterium]
MAALAVTDRNFQAEVLESNQPVLVDFWAPWCGPCRAMSGVVDEIAGTLDGRAKVVKVNVDDSTESAARYGIQSIPAFAVFVGGELKSGTTGAVPPQTLLDLVEDQLNASASS